MVLDSCKPLFKENSIFKLPKKHFIILRAPNFLKKYLEKFKNIMMILALLFMLREIRHTKKSTFLLNHVRMQILFRTL